MLLNLIHACKYVGCEWQFHVILQCELVARFGVHVTKELHLGNVFRNIVLDAHALLWIEIQVVPEAFCNMSTNISNVVDGFNVIAAVSVKLYEGVTQCSISHVTHVERLVSVWLRVLNHDSLILLGKRIQETAFHDFVHHLSNEYRFEVNVAEWSLRLYVIQNGLRILCSILLQFFRNPVVYLLGKLRRLQIFWLILHEILCHHKHVGAQRKVQILQMSLRGNKLVQNFFVFWDFGLCRMQVE
mmetsp:Transcript_1132/g.3887  ORF Transcript_1132/g.3887 Transcript_1132/m.3887 type:complete len:243 (+) Transcript_1132:1555-2283(+)